MIKTAAISASLLALTIAGGIGLSQAHSSAVSFGAARGDVTVTTYQSVAPVRATPLATITTQQTEPTARFATQAPEHAAPEVKLVSISPDAAMVDTLSNPLTTSLRPVARSNIVVVPVYSLRDTSDPAPHVTTQRAPKAVDAPRHTGTAVPRYASSSSRDGWVPATTSSRVVPNFLSGVYR